ncbi:hypothetical protein TRVL_01288 [Trypanosoma vivax]|nr:hypothetical protein TRVL_01288 [Trypanosoma vivax]
MRQAFLQGTFGGRPWSAHACIESRRATPRPVQCLSAAVTKHYREARATQAAVYVPARTDSALVRSGTQAVLRVEDRAARERRHWAGDCTTCLRRGAQKRERRTRRHKQPSMALQKQGRRNRPNGGERSAAARREGTGREKLCGGRCHDSKSGQGYRGHIQTRGQGRRGTTQGEERGGCFFRRRQKK